MVAAEDRARSGWPSLEDVQVAVESRQPAVARDHGSEIALTMMVRQNPAVDKLKKNEIIWYL